MLSLSTSFLNFQLHLPKIAIVLISFLHLTFFSLHTEKKYTLWKLLFRATVNLNLLNHVFDMIAYRVPKSSICLSYVYVYVLMCSRVTCLLAFVLLCLGRSPASVLVCLSCLSCLYIYILMVQRLFHSYFLHLYFTCIESEEFLIKVW